MEYAIVGRFGTSIPHLDILVNFTGPNGQWFVKILILMKVFSMSNILHICLNFQITLLIILHYVVKNQVALES